MKVVLASLGLVLVLAACSSLTPYDYDDPRNKRQQERDSCREDPYQDQCQPGSS